MNNKDIGPIIGYVLIAVVAFLVLMSVVGNGSVIKIANRELNKSFGITVTPTIEVDVPTLNDVNIYATPEAEYGIPMIQRP